MDSLLSDNLNRSQHDVHLQRKKKKETNSRKVYFEKAHDLRFDPRARFTLPRSRSGAKPSPRRRDIAGKTPSTSCTHDQLSLKLCKERESRICTNLSDCSPVPTASLVCYRSCSRPRTPLPAGNHDRAASSRA